MLKLDITYQEKLFFFSIILWYSGENS